MTTRLAPAGHSIAESHFSLASASEKPTNPTSNPTDPPTRRRAPFAPTVPASLLHLSSNFQRSISRRSALPHSPWLNLCLTFSPTQTSALLEDRPTDIGFLSLV